MDLVEKVARAIAEHQHKNWMFSDDERIFKLLNKSKFDEAKKNLMDAAQAAIDTVRANG
jgi:phosphopantetheine adenylyltransferase